MIDQVRIAYAEGLTAVDPTVILFRRDPATGLITLAEELTDGGQDSEGTNIADIAGAYSGKWAASNFIVGFHHSDTIGVFQLK